MVPPTQSLATLDPPVAAPLDNPSERLKRVLLAPLLVIAAPFIWFTLALRRPARLLLTYIWLLPVHVLVIAMLFGLLGLPFSLVRVVAAWKELSLLAVFGLLAVWAPFHRRAALRPTVPDLFALLLLGQAALYVALPIGVSASSLNLSGRLYGFRDAVFLALIYLVGRLAPASARDAERVVRALCVLGVVTGLLGVVDWLVIPASLYVKLGLVRYYNEFLGVFYVVNPYLNPYGLPENFWAFLGHTQLRRAGSVHASSQAFAVSFLLILPAVAHRLQQGATRAARQRWLLGLGICLVALLLTITRMTILACLCQLLALGLFWRQQRQRILLLLGAGALVVAASLPVTGRYLLDTLTLQDTSSAGHLTAWASSLEYLAESPLLGHGLGTAGQTAARAGLELRGSESQYFKFSGELGLIGLGSYLGLALTVLLAAYRSWRRGGEPAWRGVQLIVWLGGLGIAINALTTNLYSVPFLTYVYWWLAGWSVQQRLPARVRPPETERAQG